MIRVKLLDLYEKHGVTQNHVAKEAGIRVATLSGIARNSKVHLNVEILDKLCDYFELDDINELLEYVPNKKTDSSQ